MNIAEPSVAAAPSLTRDLLYAARYHLAGRRGLLVLAGVAIVTGAVLNWSWLVAARVVPLLLPVLPCVAMCALGLCMNRMMSGGSRSAEKATSNGDTSSMSVASADPSQPTLDLAVPGRPAVDRSLTEEKHSCCAKN